MSEKVVHFTAILEADRRLNFCAVSAPNHQWLHKHLVSELVNLHTHCLDYCLEVCQVSFELKSRKVLNSSHYVNTWADCGLKTGLKWSFPDDLYLLNILFRVPTHSMKVM